MAPQRGLFTWLTVALGLACGLVIVLILHFAFRETPISDVERGELKNLFRTEWLAHKAPTPFQQIYKPVRETVYPERYFVRDSETGFYPRAETKAHVVQYARDGSVNFEADYTIDNRSRRYTPQAKGKRKPFLFMGCSFVFGEGLKDDETLPAWAAKLAPEFLYYNYSVHAWGPANLLRLANRGTFGDDIARLPGGKAIYVFIDSHLERVLGGRGLYPNGYGWADNLPYYRLGDDGNLKSEGMLKSARPIATRLYGVFGDLGLIPIAAKIAPPSYSQRELRTFAAVIDELRSALTKRVGVDFYVVIYPGMRAPRELMQAFSDIGMPVLDYSGFKLNEYMTSAPTTFDGHPSAKANELLARQILHDLKLNGELE